MLQQPSRGRRDPGVAGAAPAAHVVTDPVDQLVEPNLVGGQLGELELTDALARPGHRYEVRRRPSGVLDPVGDALVIEGESGGSARRTGGSRSGCQSPCPPHPAALPRSPRAERSEPVTADAGRHRRSFRLLRRLAGVYSRAVARLGDAKTRVRRSGQPGVPPRGRLSLHELSIFRWERSLGSCRASPVSLPIRCKAPFR